MKIIFVENSYKTKFWDKVALELEKDGHEILWIVQNHFFFPQSGKKIVLSYPKSTLIFNKKDYIEEIISSDKFFNNFKDKRVDYFYHYDREIEKIIQSEYPDVIFGERKAFHELLTLYHAKSNDIPYLYPKSIGFPVGRFSFLKNDTFLPYFGSEEILNDTEELLKNIQNLEFDINLRKNSKTNSINRIKQKSINNIITTLSYFSGEKYNTNHPVAKLMVEYRKKRDSQIWERVSKKRYKIIKEIGSFNILYHIQPYIKKSFGDDINILKEILELNKNFRIYLKINSKIKHELSDELINLIEKEERVIPIPFSIATFDIWNFINLVITATGKIAIDSILTNKPVLTLENMIYNQFLNSPQLKNISDLSYWIEKIKNFDFPKISKEDQINAINILTQSSFKGITRDPLYLPSHLFKINLEYVTKGFKKILECVKDDKI